MTTPTTPGQPGSSRFGNLPGTPPMPTTPGTGSVRPVPVAPRPPRKRWEQLSPGTRKRYASYYRRAYGYDEQTIALEYNRGTLGPTTAARGHAQTPERRLTYGQATPEQRERYAGYFSAKGPISTLVAHQGELILEIPSRQQRQLIYRHWLAVRHYWSTGSVLDWSGYGLSFENILGNPLGGPRRMRRHGLAWFQGRIVTDLNGTDYELMTDPAELDEFWRTHDTEAIFYNLYPQATNPAVAA